MVKRKEVDPTTLISEVIDVIQPSFDTKNQTLNRVIADDLPPLWVDPDMIRRVLVNLMENASKFSPQDSHIEIGASLVDGHSKIWVKDDGPGIPAEDQERIFEKFSRLKVNGAIKGLGLGLTFCKLAVIGHGGEIGVESAPGKGSTFFFTLPPKG